MRKSRPGYKLVKSLFGKYEEIPEDWTLSDFKELVFFQEGPGLRHWQFKESGMKVINITNLVGKFLDTSNTNRHIDINEFEKNYRHFAIDEGDIVLASSGNSYGKISIVRERDLPLMMNTSVIRLRTKSDCMDYHYLIQFLKSIFFRQQIDLLITGAAQPNFGPSHLNQLKIKTPDINEQQKIASILSNVDNLISTYDKILSKTTRLKQALMQKLLTKGIGHKKFKKVKWLFGKEIEIPEEWDVIILNNISKKITDGEHITPIRTDDGILLLSARNIQNGHIDMSNVDYIPIEEYDRIIKRCHPEIKDILISCSGSIGRVTIVNIEKPFALVRSVALIKLKKELVIPKFLELFLQSKIAQIDMFTSVHQTSQPNLFLSKIQKLKVYLPSIPEQNRIASILSIIDNQILDLETKKKSLESLKKALMQKLLTGQIRVKV